MMAKNKNEPINGLLTRNVNEIIFRENVYNALSSGKKLRVKFGIDPTSKNLHLGHAVPLNKLREFQGLGHRVVLIIGDFTAQIGDPSGRDKTRPALSPKEIKENLKTYLKQAEKILDLRKTEVRYNSEWYNKAGTKLFAELASLVTIQQLLKRDDFQKRLGEGNDITLLEAIYPILQGYDSVMVRADIEIGGTDQKFNLLMGRGIQRKFGAPEQNIITLNLLVGTDGKMKMSKTFGNTVELTAKPEDMFGKIMSLPDNLIKNYFESATLLSEAEVKKIQSDIDGRALGLMNAKKRLAYETVKIYHGQNKAGAAKNYFEKTFQKREYPEDAPEIHPRALVDLVELPELSVSKNELRRLVEQGAVKFNGAKISDINFIFRERGVLKMGKKKFFMVVPN